MPFHGLQPVSLVTQGNEHLETGTRTWTETSDTTKRYLVFLLDIYIYNRYI